MSQPDPLLARIEEAIRDADRCPRYMAGPSPKYPEPCDGLDGCDRCLRLAAQQVKAELAGTATGGRQSAAVTDAFQDLP